MEQHAPRDGRACCRERAGPRHVLAERHKRNSDERLLATCRFKVGRPGLQGKQRRTCEAVAGFPTVWDALVQRLRLALPGQTKGRCRRRGHAGLSSGCSTVARKHVAVTLVEGCISLRARKPREERCACAIECHRPWRPLLRHGERALGACHVPPHPRAVMPRQPSPPPGVVPVQLLARHRTVRRARVARELRARRAHRGVRSETVRNRRGHLVMVGTGVQGYRAGATLCEKRAGTSTPTTSSSGSEADSSLSLLSFGLVVERSGQSSSPGVV